MTQDQVNLLKTVIKDLEHTILLAEDMVRTLEDIIND